MPAQPEHLWSTRVKHAPITCIPVSCCPGVACIFLTALLSYPLLVYPMTMARSVCTPANTQPILYLQHRSFFLFRPVTPTIG